MKNDKELKSGGWIVVGLIMLGVISIISCAIITGYNKSGDTIVGGAGGADLAKYSIDSTSLKSTASTTSFTFYSYDAKMVDYNIAFTGTAETSVLNWKNYYSYDGVTFYGEDIYTAINDLSVVHGDSVAVHTWNSSSTAIAYKNISNKELQAPWTKVVFGCETATGTVAVDIIVRNEVN